MITGCLFAVNCKRAKISLTLANFQFGLKATKRYKRCLWISVFSMISFNSTDGPGSPTSASQIIDPMKGTPDQEDYLAPLPLELGYLPQEFTSLYVALNACVVQ
jgi:hypothetical protein